VSKSYSEDFKKKMVAKLVGKHAVSANRLSQETGVSQAALSQWKRQAGSFEEVSRGKRARRVWTWTRKVEILAATAELQGADLVAYLAKEEVTLAELEEWRAALQGDRGASLAATKRIKKLERELARKEKALAEAAALLILKKKLEAHFSADEDESTDEENDE
jgi:transposase-like protein